ncbi:MAG: DUF4160 domain-containing protein [Magnetococcales bacterium]|nr:DUF4160 domain-containing protein [Magnetococcales bacterium]
MIEQGPLFLDLLDYVTLKNESYAFYGEYGAQIDIRTLEVIRGKLPRHAQALVCEWAGHHQSELMEDWELCRIKQIPFSIPPLE